MANKWLELPASALCLAFADDADESLHTRLFALIEQSYRGLGGYVDFTCPSDIPGSHDTWLLLDTNGDGLPEAVLFGKRKQFGTKWTGVATNGTHTAKAETLTKLAQLLKVPGNYAELSGPLERIMLRLGGEPMDCPAQVFSLLHKPFRWIGGGGTHGLLTVNSA